MARRLVDPEIWEKAYFKQLSPEAKLIYLCLLTHTCMAYGIFPYPLHMLAHVCGLGKEGFKLGFEQLVYVGALEVEQDFLWLPAYLFDYPPQNGNCVIRCARIFNKLPRCKLLKKILKAACIVMGKRGYLDIFYQHLPADLTGLNKGEERENPVQESNERVGSENIERSKDFQAADFQEGNKEECGRGYEKREEQASVCRETAGKAQEMAAIVNDCYEVLENLAIKAGRSLSPMSVKVGQRQSESSISQDSRANGENGQKGSTVSGQSFVENRQESSNCRQGSSRASYVEQRQYAAESSAVGQNWDEHSQLPAKSYAVGESRQKGAQVINVEKGQVNEGRQAGNYIPGREQFYKGLSKTNADLFFDTVTVSDTVRQTVDDPEYCVKFLEKVVQQYDPRGLPEFMWARVSEIIRRLEQCGLSGQFSRFIQEFRQVCGHGIEQYGAGVDIGQAVRGNGYMGEYQQEASSWAEVKGRHGRDGAGELAEWQGGRGQADSKVEWQGNAAQKGENGNSAGYGALGERQVDTGWQGVDFLPPPPPRSRLINTRENSSSSPAAVDPADLKLGSAQGIAATGSDTKGGNEKSLLWRDVDLVELFNSGQLDPKASYIALPCLPDSHHGDRYVVTFEQARVWQALYPELDIFQQLNGICGYLLTNRSGRKQHFKMAGYIDTLLKKRLREIELKFYGKATGQIKTKGGIKAMLKEHVERRAA